jgi:hypothetical protein
VAANAALTPLGPGSMHCSMTARWSTVVTVEGAVLRVCTQDDWSCCRGGIYMLRLGAQKHGKAPVSFLQVYAVCACVW